MQVRFSGSSGQMGGGWHRISRGIFLRKGNENHELGMGFFVHMKIISAVKRAEFVSDRMSYIILRGRWCHIIVLNVHAPIEDKIDDVKDTVYEELDMFCKYHMKILLGDFSAKVGRKTSSNQLFKMKVYT
jgi:hypothetical protein